MTTFVTATKILPSFTAALRKWNRRRDWNTDALFIFCVHFVHLWTFLFSFCAIHRNEKNVF